MAANPSGSAAQSVSPAAYLHLAPAYAVQPAPTVTALATTSTTTPGLTSEPIPGGSAPTLRPFTPRELKQLVMEYLCSRCYVDTAKAFAYDHALTDEAPEPSGASEDGSAVDDPSTGTSRRRTGGDPMEGVEATPEPSSSGPSAELSDSVLPSDPGPATNGKSVAFTDNDEDEKDRAEEEHVDGSLLSREDLQDARLRRTIRDSILAGRISHAVDLLNEHYPSVLGPSPTPSPTPPGLSGSAYLSKYAPPYANSPATSTCTPQSFFVAPTPLSTAASAHPASTPLSTKPLIGARFESHAQSLSPAILSLNLQTQVFIELMRSAYVTSAHSTPSTPTPSVSGGSSGAGAGRNGSGTAATDSAADDTDMSASTSSLGTFSILNVAIAQAQALAEKVSLLPPGREREGWEKERVDVSALLAYKNIESCEVRGYFEEARKEALAEMVNAAILQHTGRTPLPLLSLAARQATAFWSTLRELNIPFPPTTRSRSSSATEAVNGKSFKPARTYPAFDLHSFLHERPAGPALADGARAGDVDGDTDMA